jgi:hypothetical protein
MSHNASPTFLTLPVELVYRILDHLSPYNILLAVRGVYTRRNVITDTYHPYNVNTTFPFQ